MKTLSNICAVSAFSAFGIGTFAAVRADQDILIVAYTLGLMLLAMFNSQPPEQEQMPALADFTEGPTIQADYHWL